MFRPTLRPRKNYSTKSTEEKSFDRFRPGSISQTHIQTLATNFRHVQTFATEYTHVQTFATDFKPVHTFATEFRHTELGPMWLTHRVISDRVHRLLVTLSYFRPDRFVQLLSLIPILILLLYYLVSGCLTSLC